MGKSLTEAARAVLTEGSIPSVSSSDNNPDRDAGNSNANMATLKPKSKASETRFSNPGATSPEGEVEDLGPALVEPTGQDGPSKAAGKLKKMPARKADKNGGEKTPIKETTELDEDDQIDEDSEIDEEDDIEISEELQEFIDTLVAEGLTEEEIEAAIAEEFELVEEPVEEEIEEYTVDMSEHVEALLQGEQLSEEFKEKAKTIFESAVTQKVNEEIGRLEEAYAEALEEEIAKINDNLSENVDNYLNYVVEQWVADNEVAIESGLRTELTEDFITGLYQLFAENYVNVPEEKLDVIGELTNEVAELNNKLNEEIERNVAMTKVVAEARKNEIVNRVVEGLTDTQAEKLRTLVEGVDYTDDNQFTQKVNTLKENYFPGVATGADVLDSEEKYADGRTLVEDVVTGPMAAYKKVLGRTLPN